MQIAGKDLHFACNNAPAIAAALVQMYLRNSNLIKLNQMFEGKPFSDQRQILRSTVDLAARLRALICQSKAKTEC